MVFIYLVGVRVDFEELRHQSRVAILTSNISVILPLAAGVVLAHHLFPRYGSGNPQAFALFLGTAMSVTAFPVLARILVERNLLNTRLGSVAITCAAVDDLTAWLLLSVDVAMIRQERSGRPLWWIFLLVPSYIVIMLAAGIALRLWARRAKREASLVPW